jgi:hypothetical protein
MYMIYVGQRAEDVPATAEEKEKGLSGVIRRMDKVK